MEAKVQAAAARTGFVLLCVLGFTLPTMEAPKNAAVVLLFITFLFQFAGAPPRWRRPDIIEVGLIALVAASALSTAVNWPFPNGTKGLKDTVFLAFICWYLYRGAFTYRQKYVLAGSISIGVLFGLAWGGIEVWRGTRPALEFHSAGVVTQSAIYLGVAGVCAFAIAYFGHAMRLPAMTRVGRCYWWLAFVIMFIGLFVMGSRGGILAALVVYVAFNVIARDRRIWIVSAILLAVSIGALFLFPSKFNQDRLIAKVESMMTDSMSESDQIRRANWRAGWAQATSGEAFFFGIGPRNYSSIRRSRFHFDPPLALPDDKLNHAHNLFLTKLVEEGIVGLTAMLFFFFAILQRLYKDWAAGTWRRWEWVAAMGALWIPIIAGSVNTPWYLEHALLAMMFFGMYLPGEIGDTR